MRIDDGSPDEPGRALRRARVTLAPSEAQYLQRFLTLWAEELLENPGKAGEHPIQLPLEGDDGVELTLVIEQVRAGRRWDPDGRFPAYWPMFGREDGLGVAWYLVLLNLNRDGESAVAAVRRCAEADRDGEQILALLSCKDWREHLVAGVALLVREADERLREALWRRIELWSWVVPQLCAVASMVDNEFGGRADHVLRDHLRRFNDDDPRERPSLAKTICALTALSESNQSVDEAVRQYDRDDAGAIATYWRRAISDALRSTAP